MMNGDTSIQSLCERGQQALMAQAYLQAERLLAQAEAIAWSQRQWEVLARLYLPLQETRRQIRQRCGEGQVCMDLWAEGPDHSLDPVDILSRFSAGQLLIAGWGSMQPALEVRQLAAQRELYLETFLAAVYPTDTGRILILAPSAATPLPPIRNQSAHALSAALPEGCLTIEPAELPRGVEAGSARTYARVMDLWERLHRPLLAAADAQTDPLRRMAGYRRAIEADSACELAHQRLSEAAREMARRGA